MKTHGGLAPATLLLILLSLITGIVAVEVKSSERTRRGVIGKRDTSKVIREELTGAKTAGCGSPQDPTTINDHILALLTTKNKAKRSSDQQADQSQTIIINVDDIKDLENLEHALSMVEYESQRISAPKTKRKTGETWSDTNDSASNENASQVSPDVEKAYYEVPRVAKPRSKKMTKDIAAEISPRLYPRTPSGNLDSLVSEASDPAIKRRLKSSVNKKANFEEVNPTLIRRGRARHYNNGFQVNPELSSSQLTPADGAKFQDLQSIKPAPFSPAFSASSNAVRRTKYTSVESTTTAAPTSDAYTTRAIRRKSRKEPRPKIPENSQSAETITSQKVARNTAARDSDNKSKRFGLIAKYDVAPKPFALNKVPTVHSTEEKAFKSGDSSRAKYVIANGNHGPSSREVQVPATKVNNGRGKSVYGGRNPEGFHRSHKAQQVNIQGDFSSPTADKLLRHAEYKKSVEPDKLSDVIKVGVLPSFNAHKESAEIDSSRNANLNGNPPKQRLYTAGPTGSTASFVPTQVTSLDSESYENINIEPHALSRTNTAPTINNPTSNRHSGNAPLISTGKPSSVENFNLQSSEAGDSFRSKDSSEEVAQASSLEAKRQSGDSQETSAGYAIHETPNEGQSKESVEDSSKEGSSHHTSHHSGGGGESKATGGGHGGGGNDGGGDMQYERGGGMQQGEDHHQSKGEKGEKSYKSWHEDDKASKGHHDKERHTNYYDENDGKEKESQEEGGYHEEYKKGEKGEKGAEFGQTGKHEKGHSTKGQHFIHKKDEFEKKTEFFDEYNEEGDVEKDGEFREEHEFSRGGHEKLSHYEDKDHEEKYGKDGKHEKGGHYSEHNGRKISTGEDTHYNHDEAHGKKGGHEGGKKWGYKHTSPSGGGDDHKSR